MTICKSCRYATNNWSGGRWYCRTTLSREWSWVTGIGVETMRLCEMVNTEGDCKKFMRAWRYRDIFTRDFWRR